MRATGRGTVLKCPRKTDSERVTENSGRREWDGGEEEVGLKGPDRTIGLDPVGAMLILQVFPELVPYLQELVTVRGEGENCSNMLFSLKKMIDS